MVHSVGRYVPRPDITIDSLKWISLFGGIFGLDHFTLRSPKTAIAKLLTLGGLGVWWFWDAMQLWTEPRRVVNYGLNGPLDWFTGVGQGLMTDQKTVYEQRTNFGLWSAAAVLGFTGLDYILVGRTGQGVRRLFLSALCKLALPNPFNPSFNFWTILGIFFLGPIAIGLLALWATNAYRAIFDLDKLFSPEKDGGMPVNDSISQILNYFDDFLPEDDTATRRAWEITSIPGAELAERFWIGHPSEPSLPPAPKASWFFAPFRVVYHVIVSIIMKTVELVTGARGAALASSVVGLPSIPTSPAAARAALSQKLHAAMPQIPAVPQIPALPILKGGARDEAPSTEGMLLGATLALLIGGGAMKFGIDHVLKASTGA